MFASLQMAQTAVTGFLVPLAVCPVAPPGAQAQADKLTGYVLWGVIALFVVGIAVSIGAIVAGRVFHMQHASKAGVVGVVVVILAAIAYVTMPSVVTGILGAGCI